MRYFSRNGQPSSCGRSILLWRGSIFRWMRTRPYAHTLLLLPSACHAPILVAVLLLSLSSILPAIIHFNLYAFIPRNGACSLSCFLFCLPGRTVMANSCHGQLLSWPTPVMAKSCHGQLLPAPLCIYLVDSALCKCCPARNFWVLAASQLFCGLSGGYVPVTICFCSAK